MMYKVTIRFRDLETDKWMKAEQWLITNATNITDAEAQVYKDINELGSVGDWEISKIEQSKICKIITT